MNEKFSECQTPFSKCWCEAVPGRMNNPHCQGAVPSLSIQSDVLTFIIVSAIVAYLFYIFKSDKKPLTELEKQEELKSKLFWISLSDRYIFSPTAFYKEYFKKDGELKDKYKNI